MRNNFLFFLIPVVIFSLTSCSTVFKGTKQKISVMGNTDKPVNIYADGKLYSDITLPAKVKIKRKKKISQIAVFSDEYRFKTIDIEKKISPFIFTNILGGGFLFVTIPIDLITGSCKEAKQKDVHFDLENVLDKQDLAENYVLLGTQYFQLEKFNDAKKYYLKAIEIDSTNESAHNKSAWVDNYVRMRDRMREENRQRKYDAWDAALNTTMGILTTASQIVDATSGNSHSESSSYSESSSSTKKGSSSSNSRKGSISESTSKNTDSKTYSRCESELIKMKSGSVQYNNSIREEHQRVMRQIRQKWTNKGYSMYKSPLEDWMCK